MASGTVKVTANSGLNVRAKANTSTAVIGLLNKGKKINYTAETNGWLKVKHNGKNGYISKKYTVPVSTNAGNSAQTASSTSNKKVKITASSLNVRTGAGTNYKRLGALAKGTTVSYSSESAGWLKITYKNQTGYISKKYTAPSSASTTTKTEKPKTQTKNVKITATSLNVRSGAGTNYRKLGALTKGTTVGYSSESNGWLKITYKNQTAYISKKYTSANTNAPTNTNTKPATSDSTNSKPHDYKQYADPWGPKMYSATNNRKQTYKSSACGPTAMADIVKTRADSSATPETLGKYALKNKFRTVNSGTAWAFFASAASKYGMSCTQTGNFSELKTGLSKGALAVASMGKGYWTSGGHYICVYKHANGRVYANDPASTKRTSQEATQFSKEAKQYWLIK